MAARRAQYQETGWTRFDDAAEPYKPSSGAWDRVEGNWLQAKGKVREQWGKLTDDDLDVIAGRRDQLEGKLQERYGYAKDQARKEIDDWYAAQRW
ncbi:CsbD family protein [Salmonella enterica subsp. enterica]|nr:hypothetical protein [Salmonella enterica subsp. enterica serovar Java]EBX4817068.1 hypothetical protein [Salmonella enterica subsp. enterica serovar Newport]MIL10091.1 CsbD family protein [Salmonella enterica subsp. enterica serovar Enteritidis]